MNFLLWLIGVNLLPLAALTLSASARTRSAAPWLALATVIVGSIPAFTVSLTFVTYGSMGEQFGVLVPILYCLVTAVYGLAGLGITALVVRLGPAAFMPPGVVLAGVIYTASFYAYLPPHSLSPAGMLVFAVPGPALVTYGAILWRRNGLSGGLQAWNPGLRLVVALGVAAGFGGAGLLAYQAAEPDHPNWTLQPLNPASLASHSVLVAEGEVVNQEPWSTEAQLSSGRTRTLRYTLYRVEVSEVWRGEETETLSIAAPDWSPVDLVEGQSYLLFLSSMADQEDFPGYWRAIEPREVWTVEGDGFHPHFGLEPATLLNRQEVSDLLVENPLSTPTPQPG